MVIAEIRQGDDPWPSEEKEAARQRVRQFIDAHNLRFSGVMKASHPVNVVAYVPDTATKTTMYLTITDLEALVR